MTKVLTETNVSDLLRISAGEIQLLRKLTENLEKQVEERFEEVKELKKENDSERASAAGSGD